MKAAEITDATVNAIKTGHHRFIRINYANGDMVGHTGQLEPTISAIQALDLSLVLLAFGVSNATFLLAFYRDYRRNVGGDRGTKRTKRRSAKSEPAEKSATPDA